MNFFFALKYAIVFAYIARVHTWRDTDTETHAHRQEMGAFGSYCEYNNATPSDKHYVLFSVPFLFLYSSFFPFIMRFSR